MSDHIEDQSSRRSDIRLEEDRNFSYCPKYVKHDLNHEQVKALLEELLEIAILKLDSEERQDKQVERVIRKLKAAGFDEGKSILIHLVTLLGIAAYALYAWLSNHTFK